MDITYITTSYRDAEYLKTCNRSILKQLNVDAKHIVVVDGYSSEDLEEFKKNKLNCPQTRIIENRINKGKSACVNQAIQTCQSRYIGLLDADDVIFPEKTHKQLKYLEDREDIAIVGCSYISFLDKNKKEMGFIQAPCDIKQAWRNISLSPTSVYSSLIIDRSRYPFPALDENLECAMDYEFNLRCLKEGIISNIPGYYCGYRIRSHSITRSNKRIEQLTNHAEILLDNLVDNRNIPKEQLITLRHLYALGLSVIANDNLEIRKILMHELRIHEGSINGMISALKSLQYDANLNILLNRVVEVITIGAQQKTGRN